MSRSATKRRSRERSRKARRNKPSKREAAILARAERLGLCYDCSEAKEKPKATEIFTVWNDQCRACYRSRKSSLERRAKMNMTARRELLWQRRKEKRA